MKGYKLQTVLKSRGGDVMVIKRMDKVSNKGNRCKVSNMKFQNGLAVYLVEEETTHEGQKDW